MELINHIIYSPLFWQTTCATIVGGLIASVTGYSLTARSQSLSLTFEKCSYILSKEFSLKRDFMQNALKQYDISELVSQDSQETRDAYLNIMEIMNKYDAILHGVSLKMFNKSMIQQMIWKIIRDDHESLDGFLEKLEENFLKKYPEKAEEMKRPFFPSIRLFQKNWKYVNVN